jgi:hypothetical protein
MLTNTLADCHISTAISFTKQAPWDILASLPYCDGLIECYDSPQNIHLQMMFIQKYQGTQFDISVQCCFVVLVSRAFIKSHRQCTQYFLRTNVIWLIDFGPIVVASLVIYLSKQNHKNNIDDVKLKCQKRKHKCRRNAARPFCEAREGGFHVLWSKIIWPTHIWIEDWSTVVGSTS